MTRQRTIAACLKAADRDARHRFIKPEDREPEWMPTFTLDQQIADARREMGEARWAELNREWEV